MALKNLLQTMKTETVLAGEIDRHLMNPKRKTGFNEDARERGVWHPSSLAGCERALVFGMKGFKPRANAVSSLGQRIFDTGHHFGYMIQEYLYEMGVLYGNWRCRECKHRWADWFENPSPRKCPSCGTETYIWYNMDYMEVPVRDEENNIAGHSDGIIKTQGKFRVLELKTIKNRTAGTPPTSVTYDDLNEPHKAHLWQIGMYIHLINKEAEKVGEKVENGVVMYGAKNDQGLKEFRIRPLYELYVEPQYEKIKRMDKAISEGVVPNRPEGCINKSSWDCRFCNYNHICYETESNLIDDFKKIQEGVK